MPSTYVACIIIAIIVIILCARARERLSESRHCRVCDQFAHTQACAACIENPPQHTYYM